MADTALKNLTAGTWSSTVTLAGSDTASPTGSFKFAQTGMVANPTGSIGLTASNGTLATFARSDATHALSVAIVPTWSGIHTFSANTTVFSANSNVMTVDNSGGGCLLTWSGNGNGGYIGFAGNFFVRTSTAAPVFFQTSGASQMVLGDGQGTPAGQLTMASTGLFGFSSGAVGNNTKDTAITRNGAAVVQVNDGTAGAGHGGGINFPESAADADIPAPSSGATLFSKQVGGKNALFVRFPTGVVQQLAIEL